MTFTCLWMRQINCNSAYGSPQPMSVEGGSLPDAWSRGRTEALAALRRRSRALALREAHTLPREAGELWTPLVSLAGGGSVRIAQR